MTDSLIFLPFRLGARTARASLHATRDLAELGLATLDLVERMLGEEPPEGAERTDAAGPVEPTEAAEPDARVEPAPVPPHEHEQESPSPRVPPLEVVEDARAEVAPEPLQPAEPSDALGAVEPSEAPPAPAEEAELVEEVADAGAEDGAGASLRVAPPFPGYDELRAPDVIAHLRGADLAELGETELYERTHRARRTVLEAIGREIKRRPPNWVDRRP